MFRSFVTLVWLAVAFSSASATIDFTPTVSEFTGEGIVYRRVTFKTDKGSVQFVPPPKWTARGTAERAQLFPPDNKFAEATITARPLEAPPQPWDERTLQALEQQVIGHIPPNSASVEVLSREQKPLWSQSVGFEIVVGYKALGYTFKRSVLVVRTTDTELTFQFSAPKEEFASLNDQFQRSITSWEWVEQKPEPGGAGNAAVPTPAASVASGTP